MATPIPAGFHTLTPLLTVKNAVEAIDFYKRAFGAEETARMMSPDGQSVWHAELKIGDSYVMLQDELPEMGDVRAPQTLKGTTVSLHLYLEDADAAFQRAVDAGAAPTMAPVDAFWGDRYGVVTDPYGHLWGIATHREDVSLDEMYRRAERMRQQAG